MNDKANKSSTLTTKLSGNVLLTGGTGTLGNALAERIEREVLDCVLTVYSRDPIKQQVMKRRYPKHRYVLGDVLDLDALTRVSYGHNLIIHAAAQKHIPEAEMWPGQCYAVNVQGSMNVIDAAVTAGVRQVLGISTDKACHPVNTYGCTKLMMERYYQHVAGELGDVLSVNLVRYGNVLDSNGSVLKAWSDAVKAKVKPKVTDPAMTRFWLTDQAAVDLILYALGEPSGTISIPMLPGLAMGKMLEYLYPGVRGEVVGLRPGEKMHEELLTKEEAPFTRGGTGYLRLWPVTVNPFSDDTRGYNSAIAPELTRDELLQMVANS